MSGSPTASNVRATGPSFTVVAAHQSAAGLPKSVMRPVSSSLRPPRRTFAKRKRSSVAQRLQIARSCAGGRLSYGPPVIECEPPSPRSPPSAIHDSDVIELCAQSSIAQPMLAAMSYDALVVGSGPNGLAAAIAMAQSGWRVLVLEAAERPGGAVATEELTLPGFRHDTFSSVYPAGAASPVFARLPLQRHGLRWIHPAGLPRAPAPRRHAPWRSTATSSARQRASTPSTPGDGERWRAFAAPLLEPLRRAAATRCSAASRRCGARCAWRAGLGPRGILDFARLVLMPAQALGEELFEGGRGARVAVRLGDALRRAAGRRRQRDRGRLPEPARPRRRLAEPRGRRRQARRRARLAVCGSCAARCAPARRSRVLGRRARARRRRGAGRAASGCARRS